MTKASIILAITVFNCCSTSNTNCVVQGLSRNEQSQFQWKDITPEQDIWALELHCFYKGSLEHFVGKITNR